MKIMLCFAVHGINRKKNNNNVKKKQIRIKINNSNNLLYNNLKSIINN